MRKDLLCILALTLLGAALYGVAMGSFDFLDPDEPFYVLTAKEMIERGDPWTPVIFGQPQFEKPILFYGVLYLCFKLFGLSEASARLGPLLAGILTLWMTYFWGRVLFARRRVAFISSVILASSAEFIVCSRIVLTDIYLCLFVTAALACFTWGYRREAGRPAAWTLLFMFCGLGFATKGPLGILLPFMAIVSFLLLSGEVSLLRRIPWGRGLLLFSLTAFPWYVLMTARHGTAFLEHFFVHENVRRFFVAEHRNLDRFYLYPATLFAGFFPWSALIPAGLYCGLRGAFRKTTGQQKALLFLTLSVGLPFVFFSGAKSKLMSYIFPVFPAVALLTGAWLERFMRSRRIGTEGSPLFWTGALVFLGAAPLGIVAAAAFYAVQSGLPILTPVLTIGIFLVPLCWLGLFLFRKNRFRPALISITAGAVLFSSLMFGWLMPEADAAFASKQSSFLLQKWMGGRTGPVLVSKGYVRGLKLYSEESDVAVWIENPDRAFYTDHAVPILSTQKDLLKIDRSRYPLYGLLRDKDLKWLRRAADPPFGIEVLEHFEERNLIRLNLEKP